MSSNHAQPAVRRVQQREIAERAGVSVSTVSRVLNNAPGISEPIQQKVLAAAAELGYQRAEAKRPGRMQNISLLTSLRLAPGLDPFHADVLSGVEQACGREGLHLSYATFGGGAPSVEQALDRLRQNGVDGLLLLSVDEPDAIEQIQALNLPLVMINIDRRELPVDTVLPDNRLGALLAVRHLLAQGHRRILHIASSQRRTIRRRTEAYQAALAEAGIPFDPGLVLDVSLNPESTYEAMQRRLAAGAPDFTAAFCANDLAAMGLMRAAQEAGLRIPQDLSVVGFDDIATAAFLSPPLTTVRIEAAELATLAVRRLLDRAAAPELTPIRVSLACRLVERQSVARLRG
ncbi:MAG TPA: LacI family DNA-binding transcriptional regulator [Roseiflexaceae bacterium]|nr:LacI family DNA-binding transcriptional regulator [Roseiflexaceae bacterium]